MASELGPGKLLVLQYHSGDKYATPETEAKVGEYKVKGFPTMFFNGGNSVVGGGSGNYGQYSAVVNRELTKQSSVSIVGVMTSRSGTISLDVTITNISDSAVTSVKLMAVVYEDIGTEEHHYVVRDILPPSGIASLPPGETQKFSLSSDFRDSLSSLRAVLFLQSPAGQVLQSAIAINQ